MRQTTPYRLNMSGGPVALAAGEDSADPAAARSRPPVPPRDVAAASRQGTVSEAHPPAVAPPSLRPGRQRLRIVDGALRCIADHGVAKTTVDDVARRAGCSRATVYRVFPGGKEELLAAVVDAEVTRFETAVALRMGEADDLEDALVAGMAEAARRVAGHPALSYLLRFEPGIVLPHLAFDNLDALLAIASALAAPFLGRWLPPDDASRVAEWTTRIVLSYLSCPSERFDPADPVALRRLVRTFVLPAIDGWRHHGAEARGTPSTIDHHPPRESST